MSTKIDMPRMFPRLRIAVAVILSTILLSTSCAHKTVWRIAVSQCSDDDWRNKMNEEMQLEAMFHNNIELEIVSADDNNDKQIQDIRDLIEHGCDILIVAPNEADALTPFIKEVYEKGIPVIVFDRMIHGDSYTAFQGADNREIGQHAARMAFSYFGKDCKVLELCGLEGSTPAMDRRIGFDEEAEKLGFTIMGRGAWSWDNDMASRATDSLLTLYPEANLIYAHNDRMAMAASEVVRKRGRNDIKLIGIDAAPNIGIRAVMDSTIDATFLYPTEGHQLIRTALNILEGRPYQRNNIIPTPSAVDRTNAEILLMQDQTIRDETEKIKIMKGQLDFYWQQHSAQKWLLIGAAVIVFLLSGFIFLLLKTYWVHKRHREEMEARNAELSKQKDELNDLYNKLQEATSSKLSFFTNVSHDLRTPLALIVDPIHQIADAENLTESQKTLMRLADKNARVLFRLINQILDIRKFDNGKLKLNLVSVDISLAMREWSESFATMAQKRHIKFSSEIPETECKMAVDIDKFERVIFNLLSNAFKFTPENGSIGIFMSILSNSLTIKVSDTGCGIPQKDIDRIFEQFFQADSINPNGSGIGLALCKVFVEMHGGTIGAESQEGKGSTFTVTLPIRDIEAPETISISALPDLTELVEIQASDMEINIDAPTILLIDDNPDIRTLLKETLGVKYTILQAAGGAEGIRLATKYVPEMIICDVMMPDMDGYETCRRLKSETVTSHIPVLLLTACTQDEQRTEGYECGADGYMSKPFDSRMLSTRCESLIANRKRIFDAAGTHAAGKASSPKPSAAAQKNNIDDEFYTRFVSIIEESLADSELSVEVIADRIGLSRVQMYRKIKALTNYSPAEVLRNIRLQHASKLLKTSDMTVSEVAYSVGFTSPGYFTKCYREYFTELPTDTQARTSRSGK